jgi:hypothetical protein
VIVAPLVFELQLGSVLSSRIVTLLGVSTLPAASVAA